MKAVGTVAVGKEPTLQMGMAEESQGGGGCNQRDQGISEGDRHRRLRRPASRERAELEKTPRVKAGLAAERAAIGDARESTGRVSR